MKTEHSIFNITQEAKKKYRHDLRGQLVWSLRKMRTHKIPVSIQDQMLETLIRECQTEFVGQSKLIAACPRWLNYPKFSNSYFTSYKPREIYETTRSSTLILEALEGTYKPHARTIESWMPYLTTKTKKHILGLAQKETRCVRTISTVLGTFMDNQMEFPGIWKNINHVSNAYACLSKMMSTNWTQKRIQSFFHAVNGVPNTPRVAHAMQAFYIPNEQRTPISVRTKEIISDYDLMESLLCVQWMHHVRDCDPVSYTMAAAYATLGMRAFDPQFTDRPANIEILSATTLYRHWDEVLDPHLLQQNAQTWIAILRNVIDPTVDAVKPYHEKLLNRPMSDQEAQMLDIAGWDGYLSTLVPQIVSTLDIDYAC